MTPTWQSTCELAQAGARKFRLVHIFIRFPWDCRFGGHHQSGCSGRRTCNFVVLEMLLKSQVTRWPFGGKGPAGDCANSRANRPSIKVWQPGVVRLEAGRAVETKLFRVEVGVCLSLFAT